jgi:hypothetical protein
MTYAISTDQALASGNVVGGSPMWHSQQHTSQRQGELSDDTANAPVDVAYADIEPSRNFL